MGFILPILFATTASAASPEPGRLARIWQNMLPPEDISVHGNLIDWLFGYTTYMNIFFFGLVCAGLFGFSWLYRESRHPKALYTYGNKKVHVIIATVIGLSVFIGVDMNITRISNNDYVGVFVNWPTESENPVQVQALAQQWAWHFRYAGRDGLFNTEDDIVQLNDLRLPIDRKVVIQVLSKDVIHSLFFPNARRKVDAIPGRITRLWWQPTKAGNWDIACAEMCGTYHYRMKAHLTTYSEADYQAWLDEASEKAIVENDPENPELFWGWKWQW